MTTPKRTFVLDTNVLIADPQAIGYPAANGRPGHTGRFDEHDVVIPIRVIEELEQLRSRPFEVGFAAREALRNIEAVRVVHGTLADPVTINDQGGTVRVELNNTSRDGLHEALRSDTSDHRIIAVAKNLADGGDREVVLVSKDAPVRIKASVEGVRAEEYENELRADSGWTGIEHVYVDDAWLNDLYDADRRRLPVAESPEQLRALPINTCLTLDTGTKGALARIMPDKTVRIVPDRLQLGKLRARNAEQSFAMDLLSDPNIDLLSLQGPPGTGKTLMACVAGLGSGDRVTVFRPMDPLGDQQMGFLPGTVSEKMLPWTQAIVDSLEEVYSKPDIESMLERGSLDVQPITYLRGRTLRGHIVIDECQTLERRPLYAALSRAGRTKGELAEAGSSVEDKGQGTRLVLCWDPEQADNPRASVEAGVAALRDSLIGHPTFAHITLRASERSRLAQLVNESMASIGR